MNQQRIITVFNTVGNKKTILSSQASTKAELALDLVRNDIHYLGLTFVVGETQNQLLNDESILPEGDFTLFLMLEKQKSGICTVDRRSNINHLINAYINDTHLSANSDKSFDSNKIDWFNTSVETVIFPNKKELLKALLAKMKVYIDMARECTIGEANEILLYDKKIAELEQITESIQNGQGSSL
jgi:hypothetical protein